MGFQLYANLDSIRYNYASNFTGRALNGMKNNDKDQFDWIKKQPY